MEHNKSETNIEPKPQTQNRVYKENEKIMKNAIGVHSEREKLNT